MVSRRWILGGLGLGLVLMAASAGAESPFRRREPTAPFSVSVEDGLGRELPSYFHAGRRYVLGEQGRRYVIRLENPTSERVEAVVSVDGRDAVSGRVGDYRRERGYVLPAYGSMVIEGFRRSLSDVAAFRFADPSQSYSSRLGTPENVGVIGVAYFSERRRVVRSEPRRPSPAPRSGASQRYRGEDSRAAEAEAPSDGSGEGERGATRAEAKRSKGRASGAAPASAPSRGDERYGEGRAQNLGTEYGETRASFVSEVPFERRSSEPGWVVTLRYDDADGLSARGIELWPDFVREPVSVAPEPFPNSRFAPPPP